MKSGSPKKAPKVNNPNPKGNYMRENDDMKRIPIDRKRKLSK